MRTIFQIFRNDIKGLLKNKLALAIAVGICFLPSLYAWFNIYSNWDPYSNTDSIRVAVASDDAGYEKDDNSHVNMGDEVIENLKENDKIGWTFVDTSEEAIEGVRSGEYYAAIIIGEDFSESMYGFTENGLQRPHVTYYQNDKKNAIAAKITDTAKDTLQTSINEEFVYVAVETVMESMNDLADDAKKSDYIEKLIVRLHAVNDNLNDYALTLDQMMECNTTLASNLSEAGSKVTGASGKLESSVNSVNSAKAEAKQTINVLSENLDQTVASLQEQMQTTSASLTKPNISQEDLDAAKAALESSMQLLGSLNELIENPIITDTVTKDSVISLIQNISNTTSAVKNAINNEIKDNATIAAATQLMNAVMPIVEQQLKSDINTIKSNINSAYNSMVSSLNSMNEGLKGTGIALESLSDTVSSANGSFLGLKNLITSANEKIESLIGELEGIQDGEKYEQLIRVLASDPEEFGDFFSEPVTVNTVAVYEIKNYGSSVAPFYTILALWVGAVILVAIVKVNPDKEKYPDAKPYQLYFGRFILFFALGQLQAAIVVLGDLYLLKIQCLEPMLFYLVAVFASFTFNLLIYTLTVSFGDVGKALVVVVMVIQIAGSSGTYPIEILPDFYQNIYVYFPFPYAINAMRETIGGMYQNDYWAYMSQLSVFALIALAVGLIIRKPFMKVNHFMEQRMEDTKMM